MSVENSFLYYNEALLNMGAISSASELQGYLCGKMSVCAEVPDELPDSWLEQVQAYMDLEFLKLSDEQAVLLVELYRFTHDALKDDSLGFRPLLPEDEASLQRRTEELAAWCRGFLYGLGSSGLQAQDQLSAETAEALRDLAKISQAEMEDEIETLEDDWENLVEYVKVAVLTIDQECGVEKHRVH